MNEQLVNRIRQCPSLPSLPSIAIQVLDLAQRPEADIAEIARVISKDPALATKILRTVNSSFYGRSQHVSTVSHALVILGLQSVKTLVLGFSLVSDLSKTKAKGVKHLEYWRRSIFAATAARTIAARLNIVQQEEARSEERRVGKECRCRWSAEDQKKNSSRGGMRCERARDT